MADTVTTDDSRPTITESSYDVIILSGQSNMSGRGGVQTKHHNDGSIYREWDHVVPSECEADGGAIYRLNRHLNWEAAHEPLHHDIDLGKKVCGLGPGLVFAASVLRWYKASCPESIPAIGLVPCAVGGTQIKDWEKGSKLYEQMIARTKAAVNKSGTLRAILWYQGESDTMAIENVKAFPQRLSTLITNIRTDLQNDNLPIIQVGITAAHHSHPEYLEEVRQAQRALNMPSVYYVDAKGLPLLEDNIHLNREAQVRLGQMLADVYVQHVGNSSMNPPFATY